MFRHHPDGIIYIDEVAVDLATFRRYEPGYALPEGYTGREYDPDVRHNLITHNSADPQEAKWAEGDRYLSKKAHYARLMARSQIEDAPLLERKVLAPWQ